MKFPTEGGIATVKGRQNESQAVYLATLAREEEEKVHREIMKVRDKEKEQKTQQAEELESFTLSKGHLEKTFSMNADLNVEQKEAVKALVQWHANSFT